jgi:phage terminase large subunit
MPKTKAKKLTFAERIKQEAQQQILEQQHSLPDLAQQFIIEATIDYPWQRTFINDKNPRKALFGERRGSKTTLMALSAIEQCLRVPFSQVLYIGLTQDSCKRAMYDQILARILRKHNLPAKLVYGNEMRFENGSIIYLIGMDANEKQKEKARGVKSSLNLIDEMQSFTQDTSTIINEVLGPTAADTKSAMIIGGTAGNALGENYWYEITKDNTKETPVGPSTLHPEWIVYRCQWANNTAIDEQTGNRICDNVKDFLDKLEKDHPGTQLTDAYRQEWNAEWIVQKDALIYRYSEGNLLTSQECLDFGTNERIPMPSAEFLATATKVLGIDLGYNDPTALTTVAYNTKYSNKLYVLETFNQSEMIVADVAAKIKQLDKLYHYTYMVGDSSSLQVFETLKQTYGFNIEKANRQGKLSHQLVLNSDLQTRSVVFMPGTEELINQLKTCQWEAKPLKEGRYVEDSKYKNDLSDSFLYAFYYSRHHWYQVPKPKPGLPTGQDQQNALTKELFKRNKLMAFNNRFQ